MMVDSTEESFKAPQAAFAAGEEKSEKCNSKIMLKKLDKPGTIIVEVFNLPLNIFKDNSNHPHNSQD